MKRFITLLILLWSMGTVHAQLNNEWIDYSKTYYKFKVGTTGLHRIPFAVLQGAGLSAIPMEQFQLFRNGKEVPLYTSKANGVPGTSDFIEFYGQQNDGKPDAQFYKQADWQLNSTVSLLTDTATYFLTVNPSGVTVRLRSEQNNVVNNTLTPEPSFTYSFVRAFKDKINLGNALVSGGSYIYSSSYEAGEGWTSRDIYPGSPISETYNLYPASNSGNASFSISYSGNTVNMRNVEVTINSNSLFDESLSGFNSNNKIVNFPHNYLGNSGGDVFVIRNKSGNGSDRIVAGELKITYTRQFNFGGAKVFEFDLSANASGNYLEITNFNSGATEPVLYDLTNNTRYVGVVSSGVIKYLLKPSTEARKLVMLSSETPVQVSTLETRVFTDYRKAVAQGDYLIITNNRLKVSSNGNPVENYRAYRASSAGGGYNAKVYDIEELVDQFGFGIRWNPLGIKNFIQLARTQFTVKPKFIFFIGRGLLYNDARVLEKVPTTHELNLVPTYGQPGSDNLLVSAGFDVNVDIPVGRLAAINGNEVEIYLQKVKLHESGKSTAVSTIKDRAWRKNIVHAIGGSDPYLQSILTNYMSGYQKIAQDTLLGAKVNTFSKSVNITADLLNSDQLSKLFEEGISLLTYFGHSATEILEFNIDDPENYNNPGKYPFFLVNGCFAGNIFVYDTLRVRNVGLTLSEKFNLAKERGSIGFLANSHTGVVNYLNVFTDGFYKSLAQDQYGKSYGEIHRATLNKFANAIGDIDFLGKTHKEQMVLHADPAVVSNGYQLPDYVIEDPLVKINPNPISVADKEFKLDVHFVNIGKAIKDSIRVLVQRKLPGGSIVDIYNKKIAATKFEDSLLLVVPINPITDKGANRIIVSLDVDNKIVEQSELNNVVYKDFNIIEDDIRPVYPLSFSIHNQPISSFYASIANPLQSARTYLFEIDTTELFSSSQKISVSVQNQGGLVKFNPSGINWKDSTVYYWRTAPQAITPNWSSSSFMYLKNNPNGFGQSHYFQHLKSDYSKIKLENNRQFTFDTTTKKFAVKTGINPSVTANKYLVTLDEVLIVNYGCRFSSLQIVVLDGKTLKPWENLAQSNGFGLYGSLPPCIHNEMSFEFPYSNPQYRKNAVEFLESLPAGVIVSITNFGKIDNQSFIYDWMADTVNLGKNRSLYHVLKKYGFTAIDNFTRNVPFFFLMRKNGAVIKQSMGASEYEYLEESALLTAYATSGTIKSPWFGPATKWTKLKWDGRDLTPSTDLYKVDLYAKDAAGQERLLFTTQNMDTSISTIDPKIYPFLRMQLRAEDTIQASPYQLKYWILTGTFPPEGAISLEPNMNVKDTVEAGEAYPFEMAFKNISSTAFDSLQVKLSITSSSNVTTDIPIKKLKPLVEGDTVLVRQMIDTRKLSKDNLLYVNFNPDGAQPEQYLFNNFLYKSIYVKPDEYKPVLDVTFDGVRILNEDIVSSKPRILIKLTDNNKYLMLDDTSLLTVKVKFPNNQIKVYRFDNDTVRFTPAIFSNGVKENAATIDFLPFFKEDGLYELIVTGADKSGNNTSFIEYKVAFNVVNKAMISDLLNYPNPFTSSTAFVFTLTGAQVPQNLRIQILTITGKIVREITKDELGPIHIGRNITEYKWDGTDQFGQKLANGVYLYRVITNLNGKSLEKLDSKSGFNSVDQKYFTNGYGKMYLMR